MSDAPTIVSVSGKQVSPQSGTLPKGWTFAHPEETMTHEAVGANGTTVAPLPDIAEEDRLENHPLWPEFLKELAAIRQADKEQSERDWAE